ncbi:MAG: SUF system NifU family Fe-S cluster assembly protein [Patescibacteria group bacterium]
MTMYHDLLMDHYKNPRNFGCKDFDSTTSSHMHNPSCGDKILLKLKISDNKIVGVCFDGYGCALSTASASMLTECLKGKTIDEAKSIGVSDITKILSIDVSPARLKCATMPLEALHEALKSVEVDK